ncbi:cytochrome C oxidase assembly protein [Paenibacillus swuensis]|uniref:Cytochrome C oxidase assembly protein n=1 Tax=Paenibacillus swuensis TaxID=1178515 RepID=A0A172TES6_9BACL|nr:cytochrome c oxidase assembly factor CtaG [Paenibacillus swuensis]ANE45549.1 cytochrome C oxidase assembly protein [Paenibacillus swuensis]
MWGLDVFGYTALFSPFFMIFMLFIAASYWLLTGPQRNRFKDSVPVTKRQQTLFYTGLFLFYLVQGGPLDLMGHLMFTFHMLVMSISYIIVPPLILLGIPAWIWRPFLRKLGNPQNRALMHPIFTAVLFNTMFSFYHIPQVHDTIMTNYALHTAYYLALLVAAFMMWWHIMCPVPEYNRLTELRKMGYIFLNGLLLTPSCALIIFAGDPMYAVYNDPKVWADAMGYCVPGNPADLLKMFEGGPSTVFNLMSPLDDQQLGGTLMKLLQEAVFGVILAYVFRQWFKRENKEENITRNGQPI